MWKKTLWVIVGFGLLAASVVTAQETPFEFDARYWFTTLSAETKFTQNNQGTDINLKSDLGVGDKNFPYGRFTFSFNPSNRLAFTYTPVSYGGDSRLRRKVEFGGETYEANIRVVSDLKMHYMRLGWAYQFINLEGGKFKAGTLVELKGVQGEVSLAAPDLATPIDKGGSFYAVLPTLGLALDVNPFPYLNIFAEVSGLPAGKYGTMWEAEAGVKVIPFKNFSISGGYRLVDIEARNDPDYAKVKVGGPYLGLSLRF
ncbi:MAG: hypothetical protein AB1585_02450 [Thermodesulfobacteriota bacterium]